VIEVVSWPEDLSEWDPQQDPYYLELGGETSPILDAGYAGRESEGQGQSQPNGIIYEYWWTISHPGFRPQSPHWYDLFTGGGDGYTMWTHLREVEKNVAARVYLFFPRNGNWRIKEITAAVTYLTPMREHEPLLDQAAADWSRIQPYVSGVSQLAGAAAGTAVGGPVGGAVAGGAVGRAVDMLGTLAKVQLTSVPQTGNLAWAVGKMTTKSEYGVMQGVAWTLPKAVFELLGGRITGTLSLSVIPAAIQQQGQVATQVPEPQKLPVLAHSVVYATKQDGSEEVCWQPASNRFLKLQVQPRFTPSTAPVS